MMGLRKIPLILMAVLLNSFLFILVPLLQILLGTDHSKQKKDAHNLATPETFIQQNQKQEEKKLFKSITTHTPTKKPASPMQRTVAMDLSVAQGGEGVAVSTGDIGAVTYLPGETDTDAEILGGQRSPQMPVRAQREGVSGIVDALWVVNEAGVAVQIDILREEPQGYGFAREVQRYLKTLKFRPATLKNVPVRQQLKQRFSFNVD